MSSAVGVDVVLESNDKIGYYFRVSLKNEKELRSVKGITVIETSKSSGCKFKDAELEELNEEWDCLNSRPCKFYLLWTPRDYLNCGRRKELSLSLIYTHHFQKIRFVRQWIWPFQEIRAIFYLNFFSPKLEKYWISCNFVRFSDTCRSTAVIRVRRAIWKSRLWRLVVNCDFFWRINLEINILMKSC